MKAPSLFSKLQNRFKLIYLTLWKKQQYWGCKILCFVDLCLLRRPRPSGWELQRQAKKNSLQQSHCSFLMLLKYFFIDHMLNRITGTSSKSHTIEMCPISLSSHGTRTSDQCCGSSLKELSHEIESGRLVVKISSSGMPLVV